LRTLHVLENVVLGAEPGRLGVLDFAAAKRRIREISAAYGLDIRRTGWSRTSASGTGSGRILKVLYRGPRILILDEPTAVLVPQERRRAVRQPARAQGEGLTVLFISHKLDEVLAVADEITVIRRGTTVRRCGPPT